MDPRRQAQLLAGMGVELPGLAARAQTLVHVAFGQVEPAGERYRLLVIAPPEVVEQVADQFAPAADLVLVGRKERLPGWDRRLAACNGRPIGHYRLLVRRNVVIIQGDVLVVLVLRLVFVRLVL